MYLGLFSFGGGEIFIVLIAVLLLFGANKIPELARMVGKGMNEFKRATDDIKKEFNEGASEFKKDIDDTKKDIDKHIHEIGESVNDIEDDYDPYQDIEDYGSDEDLDIQEEDNETEPENLAQPRAKKTDTPEKDKKEEIE